MSGARRSPNLEAKYANYFEVGSNDVEFFLLFGQTAANEGEPPVIHTRIVVAPAIAREISGLLFAAINGCQERYDG